MDIRSCAPQERGAIAPQAMADGVPLFRREWPLAEARDAVLVVHGLGEHSGRYAALAAWLNRQGYAVRGYDQRGHGRSPGRRGALPYGETLLDDLAAVYADYANELPAPPVLLGHSMGALVALRCALDGRIRPSRLVLSSPALRSWASPFLRRLAAVLARCAPSLPLRNGLPLGGLSHDPAAIEGYASDPLRHGRITPRLADFIFRAGAACIADAPRLAVPTLLLVAGADRLVDPAGSRAFAAAAPARRLDHCVFESLYHELFNEAEPARSEVLAVLGAWLERHAAAARPPRAPADPP
jgi:alpha-beta hydrolase superfamily lysophospholipase